MAAFGSFLSSCQDLSSSAGQMLEPVTVQMFHVRVDTGERQAQSGAMFPGEPEAFGSVAARQHPIPVLLERVGQRAGQCLFVLDHE